LLIDSYFILNPVNFKYKSASNVLGEGSHVVTINKMVETTDQHADFNGEEIVVKEDWIDATPQLAVVYSNKDGVFTHRYNAKGYKRFADLTKEQQAKCTSAGTEGYAVSNKTKMRIEDSERTDKAFRFLDDLCAHAGVKEGEEIQSAVGKQITVVIEANAQGNLRVTKTRKAMTAVLADDLD
jgi:hypothetical protein